MSGGMSKPNEDTIDEYLELLNCKCQHKNVGLWKISM